MHINFSTPTLLYILYVPFILGVVIPLLPTMTMEIVDDSDPRIEYHPGSWIKNSNSSVDHGGTNHTTTEDASIQFQFDGILIQVFGTISAPIPRVQYKVDGQITGKLPQTLANTPNQILYQSEPLTPGNHTLIIAIDSNDPPFVFSLDYLVVVNTNHNPSSSASPTSETTVVSTAAPENDLPHSKSQVNVGGVVGGVIAALVFLATLALCFLHWRRQHRVAVCHSITRMLFTGLASATL
ncbi:hypothetical protein E1B28_004212 [Marasmius oreades]|uniref:Uncharacterized protein n=1 Tax=Marasmius oreades TaxID=181124 RepID=A0A9P7UY64_9AGAR|nr:uncharacterized protein E1B28_004212 [Marasmius oreades]KAG7096803.1 hypothetical protein E1B28_004212 [Marasmius oreades]